MRLSLGNRAPADPSAPPGRYRCDVTFPEGTSKAEALLTLTVPEGAWAAQSTAPPAWVAGDDAALVELVAEHYGAEIRELDESDPGHPIFAQEA